MVQSQQRFWLQQCKLSCTVANWKTVFADLISWLRLPVGASEMQCCKINDQCIIRASRASSKHALRILASELIN